MYQIKIGLRSLFYRKSQYVSLFLVCAVGIAISLASIFVSRGMIKAMTDKAEVYYGGDFVFMAASRDEGIEYIDWESYVPVLRKIFGKNAIITPRIDFDARHSAYYFEGVEALQKTIKGVDFENEAPLFENLYFVEGGIDGMKGTNGVLISKPIAEMLGVHVGDAMTFMFENYFWTKNTVDVVVKGIFQDSSAFGMYTSYMDFDFLREAYMVDEQFLSDEKMVDLLLKVHPNYNKSNANRIIINFPNRNFSAGEIARFQSELEKVYNMHSLVSDKDDFIDNDKTYEKITYALIPLSANLTDVKIMQKAMDAVVSFIIFMLTIIIIAGIGSTYRVLIMKRINEIGIYMAIGMKKVSIAETLLFESLVLLLLGCFAGLILSGAICGIMSTFNFSFIPAFDMFLVKGNLSPSFDVIKCVAVILAVIIVTLFAVLFSTYKSIKVLPVQALATTE